MKKWVFSKFESIPMFFEAISEEHKRLRKGEELVHGSKNTTWCKDNLDIPLCGRHATVDEMIDRSVPINKEIMYFYRVRFLYTAILTKFPIKAFVL